LLSVKLPSEIKRSTRPLYDKSHYKANEFRTILTYLAFGMFKGLLEEKYLKNLLNFIICIRLLCQDKIHKTDVTDAKLLINDFLNEYEDLYGEDVMLSNAHGHLHLPQQVLDTGPANKTIGYPFESMLKHCKDKFHGTRNFEGQIAFNLSRKKLINVELKDLSKKNEKNELADFIKNHFLKPPSSNIDTMLKIENLNNKSFTVIENNLIKSLIHVTDSSSIMTSQRAIINRREYHTQKYDSQFESQNNNTVEFDNNKNEISYGIITNFLKLENKKMYCVIKKIIVDHHDRFFNSLNLLTLKHIHKFFLMVKLTNDYELVEFKNINRKCIIFEYKNSTAIEYMLMPCENLNDCD